MTEDKPKCNDITHCQGIDKKCTDCIVVKIRSQISNKRGLT